MSPRPHHPTDREPAAPAQPPATTPEGQPSVASDPGQPVFLPNDPFAEFHALVHLHHLAKEHQQAKDEPGGTEPKMEYLSDSGP
jgi:hypothetical protein